MTSMSRPVPIAAGMMLAAVGIAALTAGCTMCPDSYDYTGPVPNGSPPHNDFRARSNGIIPIGVAPRPWPPIVKSDPAGDPTPEADPVPVMVADYGGADARPTLEDEQAVAVDATGELPPALVLPPLAELEATVETESGAAEAPEPAAIAGPAPEKPRRGGPPSFREASRWLRWR